MMMVVSMTADREMTVASRLGMLRVNRVSRSTGLNINDD